MGKQLGCDVGWVFAPEGTVFYAEGYFRNIQGDWWDEIQTRWRSPRISLEELLEAGDYEPKPIEIEMEESDLLDRLQEQAAMITTVGGTYIELEAAPIKSDGGSSSYYDIQLPDWLFDKLHERKWVGNCYIKTEELIEVLGSDFDEGNILKCLVRINSLKKGKGKEGNDVTYDSNKIIYSAGRLKERDKR